jgi:hypothetical protein
MFTRIALLALALIAVAPAASAQDRAVTYETLTPYGDWVVTSSYGRVWHPHASVVGVDFVPYASSGRWVHTDMGWEFDAPWDWGWLPFHYGRWYLDDAYGWVWVPGDVWAPAWVEWRYGGGYIGWAPLGPPRWHSRWYFVEQQHFAAADFWRHRANEANEQAWYRTTRPLPPPSGRAYAAGPSIEQVRASSRSPVIERAARPPAPNAPFTEHRGPAMRDERRPEALPGARDQRGEAAPATREERRPEALPGARDQRRDERRPDALPTPRSGETLRNDGRPPVPAAALPPPATPVPRGAVAPAAPPPAALAPSRGDGRPPVPTQALPPPATPDTRRPVESRPLPQVAAPIAPAPAPRHDRVEPPPMHEPAKSGQEPFHPMIEPSPSRGSPTIVRPAQPPPAAAQPQPQPAKRPQAQPAGPAAPTPAAAPGRAHPMHP